MESNHGKELPFGGKLEFGTFPPPQRGLVQENSGTFDAGKLWNFVQGHVKKECECVIAVFASIKRVRNRARFNVFAE